MRDFARPGRFGAQALIVVRLLRRGKGKMVNREAARQHNATTSQDVDMPPHNFVMPLSIPSDWVNPPHSRPRAKHVTARVYPNW
jgi:hypothetical protein